MKFGKRLKRQIEECLPEWRDKFLSYKDLKQLVRQISVATPSWKELQERIKRVIEIYRSIAGSEQSAAEYAAEMRKIRKDIVNLHGEMVLLENYSSINYTGLAKILKKCDKRTGGLLRLPFIEKVLKQPFFTTDLISKLVKECENTMEIMFPVATQEQPEQEGEEAFLVTEKRIYRNTVAALLTLQELREGSSTYGYFSLPPVNLPDADILQPFQLPSPITIL